MSAVFFHIKLIIPHGDPSHSIQPGSFPLGLYVHGIHLLALTAKAMFGLSFTNSGYTQALPRPLQCLHLDMLVQHDKPIPIAKGTSGTSSVHCDHQCSSHTQLDCTTTIHTISESRTLAQQYLASALACNLPLFCLASPLLRRAAYPAFALACYLISVTTQSPKSATLTINIRISLAKGATAPLHPTILKRQYLTIGL